MNPRPILIAALAGVSLLSPLASSPAAHAVEASAPHQIVIVADTGKRTGQYFPLRREPAASKVE